MFARNCLISNFILGISLALVNILPQTLTFELEVMTYVYIALFDVLALVLTFALDFKYSKDFNFKAKDIVTMVVFPLVIPSIVVALICAFITLN